MSGAIAISRTRDALTAIMESDLDGDAKRLLGIVKENWSKIGAIIAEEIGRLQESGLEAWKRLVNMLHSKDQLSESIISEGILSDLHTVLVNIAKRISAIFADVVLGAGIAGSTLSVIGLMFHSAGIFAVGQAILKGLVGIILAVVGGNTVLAIIVVFAICLYAFGGGFGSSWRDQT